MFYNLARMAKIACIAILCCLFFAPALQAEPTPRWATKGVKDLNDHRLSQTYSFQMFEESMDDEKVVVIDPFQPLRSYISSVYGVEPAAIAIDSVPSDNAKQPIYKLQFAKDGVGNTVYAQRVDQYSKYDNDLVGYGEYHYYQLYAITEPGVTTPAFDDFKLTRNYGGVPVAMSLIPGLGQIYKGQKAKGYTILGVELALVASVIGATTQIHRWDNMAKDHPAYYENYQSKAKTFRQWRTFSLVAGGALYLYNIFDAAFSKGPRFVKISSPNKRNMELSFVPFYSFTQFTSSYGLGINITF